MKERFKMIFDRIDIFVVCIVFGLCLTVAEACLGSWGVFLDCLIMVLLVTVCCYTSRRNEKLKKELAEANWRRNVTEKELDVANQRCSWRQKLIDLYSLLVKKRNAQFECEHAKLNYCKYKITLEELVSVMNRTDKKISEISDKIVELKKELREFYK